MDSTSHSTQSKTGKIRDLLSVEALLKNLRFLRGVVFFSYTIAGLFLVSQILGNNSYQTASWLYLKLYGFVSLVAFLSIRPQILGLIGVEGISPAQDAIDTYAAALEHKAAKRPAEGWRKHLRRFDRLFPSSKLLSAIDRFIRVPTLCWFSTSDRFLMEVCIGGIVASVCLMVGVFPAPLLVGVVYLCYSSIYFVSEDFLSLQWDILLLESGILSLVLAVSSHGLQFLHVYPSQVHEPSKFAVFPLQWLLFKLMFSSGIVKLSRKDPAWLSLTAMEFHYCTQPIPSPLSHPMHNMPKRFHKVETLGTFVIELFLPFLLFAPLPLRVMAVASTALLNVVISLTGNYGFFNLLTIVLGAISLDDRFWRGDLDLSLGAPHLGLPSFSWMDLPCLLFAAVVLAVGVELWNHAFATQVVSTPRWVSRLTKRLSPWHFANPYGLFAVMTKKRIELIIEGSVDGENWMAYEFKYKPGDVNRRGPWIPGHMPRLDWQLWFCPFRKFPYIPPWFARFLEQLWKYNPNVMRLLDKVPFPEDSPPQFLRVLTYDYTFTTEEEYKRTGRWWNRKQVGRYIPFTLSNTKNAPASSE